MDNRAVDSIAHRSMDLLEHNKKEIALPEVGVGRTKADETEGTDEGSVIRRYHRALAVEVVVQSSSDEDSKNPGDRERIGPKLRPPTTDRCKTAWNCTM